ncbi:MAG: hypothetical protein ABUK01_10570 [Leptospirales bacterium]
MKNRTILLLIFASIFFSCKTTEDAVVERPLKKLKENIHILAMDRGTANPSKDKNIYYKLFIDREPVAKTTAGLFFHKKKVFLKLEPGRYLFKAERWELDEADKEIPEYRRSNNIWQMSEAVYIDVPDRGAVEIQLGYDHSARSFYITTNAP